VRADVAAFVNAEWLQARADLAPAIVDAQRSLASHERQVIAAARRQNALARRFAGVVAVAAIDPSRAVAIATGARPLAPVLDAYQISAQRQSAMQSFVSAARRPDRQRDDSSDGPMSRDELLQREVQRGREPLTMDQ